MRLIICCALTAFLRSSTLLADSVNPRQDLGVVCLDELTGKPLWEYFPESPGLYQIRLDHENLYFVRRSWRTPKAKPIIEAVNLATRQRIANPTLPADDRLIPEPKLLRSYSTETITTSGDRIAASRRTITVIDRTDNTIRWTLSLPQDYGQHFLHGDLIIYTQPHSNDFAQPNPNDPPRLPRHVLTALDSRTTKQVWNQTFQGAEGTWRFYEGEKQLYLIDNEGIRAIDPSSGKLTWRSQIPRPSTWARVVEHDGMLFVRSSYVQVLDASNGAILWTFDPGCTNLPLFLQDGKVYTKIAPTKLIRRWRVWASGDGEGRILRTAREALDDLIGERFSGKSDEEIELHLRAWHVLGDRSAIPLMRKIAETLSRDRVEKLVDELLDTFPNARDQMALIKFLNEEFDRSPELSAEISLIVLDFNPIPYWYGKKTIGFPPRPAPKITFTSGEQAVIDAYGELKSKTSKSPFGRVDQSILRELAQGRGTIGLEMLLKASDEQDDPEQRSLITRAMFTRHPREASDWALQNSDRLSKQEEYAWGRMAPFDWIEAHPKVYTRWLRDADTSIQLLAGFRLQELSKSFAVAASVELLREYATSDENVPVYGVDAAIRYLARDSTPEHVSLIKKYLVSNVKTVQRSIEKDVEFHTPTYTLRKAALNALQQMGVEADDTIETKGERQLVGDEEAIKKWRDKSSSRTHIEKLHSDMLNADYQEQESKAKGLARELLAAFKHKTASEYFLRGNYERDAYKVLEEWDKFIGSCRGEDRCCGDRALMEALAEAGRIDELQSLLEDTYDPYLQIDGGYYLLESMHLEKAFEIFSDYLEKDSGSYEACVGLAVIHRDRGE